MIRFTSEARAALSPSARRALDLVPLSGHSLRVSLESVRGLRWWATDGTWVAEQVLHDATLEIAVLPPRLTSLHDLIDGPGVPSEQDRYRRPPARALGIYSDGSVGTLGLQPALQHTLMPMVVDGQFDSDACLSLFDALTGGRVLRRRADSVLPGELLFGFEPPRVTGARFVFSLEWSWDLIVVSLDLETTRLDVEVRASDGATWHAKNNDGSP